MLVYLFYQNILVVPMKVVADALQQTHIQNLVVHNFQQCGNVSEFNVVPCLKRRIHFTQFSVVEVSHPAVTCDHNYSMEIW